MLVLESLSATLAWTTAAYLLALGVLLLISPARGRRFLAGFAQTASAHAVELGLRILIGAAFILHAPRMAAGSLFVVLGWVLIGSSLVLACMPWRWHARIAQRTVPMATRFTVPLGLASIVLGIGLGFALLSGPTG
ncbi:MAG TPA: hypothetical protein VN581_09685 [Patescibacteria group bacterium]|nr:hypothetical protein [Patescibacteria group bacterium]